MLVKERNRVSEIGLWSSGRASRTENTIRERIRQRRTENHVSVGVQLICRRNKVGCKAESGLDDVAASFTQESIKRSKATTEDCLVIYSERETESWHKVADWSLIQTPRLAVNASKQQ